jgi:hypothetical protein
MRTSGGSGNEGWIMAIPLIALIAVASLSTGGIDGALSVLDGTLRHTVASVARFISQLFN